MPGLLLAMPFMVATRPAIAHAQGVIVISPIAGRALPGTTLAVPLVLDMSGAPAGTNVAMLSGQVTWDPGLLHFDSLKAGAFGTLTVTTATAVPNGFINFSLTSTSGTTSTVTLLTLYATTPPGGGGVQISTNVLSMWDPNYRPLLQIVRAPVQNVCIAPSGLLGDGNGDGTVNIIDAQQIARFSVGLSVVNPADVVGLGDVTGDSIVNIIDAQQIARFAVNLPVRARINTVSAITPTVAGVNIFPSVATLVPSGTTMFYGTPVNASGTALYGCVPLAWSSSDSSIATIDTAGVVTAVAFGTAVITATAQGKSTRSTMLVAAPVMAANGGNNQFVPAGTRVPISPSIRIADVLNHPYYGVPVTFSVTSGGGSVNVQSMSTDAAGVATVGGWTVGTSVGANTLSATASGFPPVVFTATGAGPPATISVARGENQVQAQNTPAFIGLLDVIVRDAMNNPVPGASVTYASDPGGGVVYSSAPGAVTPVAITDATGHAYALWNPTGSTVGAHTVTASAVGLAPATFHGRIVGPNSNDTRCELTIAGAAYCWGDNAHGQGGNGTTAPSRAAMAVQGGLQFVSLADGSAGHACGLTVTGRAYCWGANAFGQLGDGTTTDRSTPVMVQGGITFTQLAVAPSATCGRTPGYGLMCWGSSGYGLLGDSVQGVVHLAPTRVNSGVQFTSVQLGVNHACAIALGGALYCWGSNLSGELGNGIGLTGTAPAVIDARQYLSVALGMYHTCGITTAGQTLCWGGSSDGQLGNGGASTTGTPVPVAGGVTFASLTVGSDLVGYHAYSCGLSTLGQAYCWGSNTYGNLGDGTTTSELVPTPVLTGVTFSSLRARQSTTCARAQNGHPYCWGLNDIGQVGDGTAVNRLTPTALVWPEGRTALPVGLSINAGDGQSASVGHATAIPPSVMVTDFAGVPVSGVSVTFNVSSGGGSVIGSVAITDGSGMATVGAWTLGASPGLNTLTVTSPSLPTVTVKATGF